jgi:hypothetical protein
VNTEISEVNRNLCKSSKSETKWYRYSHCSIVHQEKHPSMEIRITDENENLISICKFQYDFTKKKRIKAMEENNTALKIK